MSLNDDDIKQIFRFMDASDFEELNLKTGDLHLIVSKRKGGCATPQAPTGTEAQTPPGQRPAQAAGPPEIGEAPEVVKPVPTRAPEPAIEEGLTPITAPTLGVFYQSPKPESPPFVQEGDLVEENDTVCIIEVMKLFNHIKAGVKGRVAKICADNGAMVEHGQLLFLIEPESN